MGNVRIHGHNYRGLCSLIGEELDEAGLLLDFKLLKQVMRPVVGYLDHQMINDLEPFTTLNPSAENLARYFYQETVKQLHEMTEGRVRIKDLYSLRDGYQLRPLLRVDLPSCI